MLTISNEFKFYTIGLFQGDGNLSYYSKNKIRLSYEISERDKDIIYKINSKLDNKCRISTRTRDTNFKKEYKSILLRTSINEITKFYTDYIPIGSKSKIISPPENMNNVESIHYIRGLTDADGSIGISKNNIPFWSLCTSSDDIKEFIISFIKKNINIDIRITKNKYDCYSINLYSENAIEFCNNLYNNTTIFIDRKYSKYQEFNNWVRSSPRRKGNHKKWLPYEDKMILFEDLSLEDKSKILNRSIGSIKMRYWRIKKSNN